MLDEESSPLAPLPLLGLQGFPMAALGGYTPWQDSNICHAKVDWGDANTTALEQGSDNISMFPFHSKPWTSWDLCLMRRLVPTSSQVPSCTLGIWNSSKDPEKSRQRLMALKVRKTPKMIPQLQKTGIYQALCWGSSSLFALFLHTVAPDQPRVLCL